MVQKTLPSLVYWIRRAIGRKVKKLYRAVLILFVTNYAYFACILSMVSGFYKTLNLTVRGRSLSAGTGASGQESTVD